MIISDGSGMAATGFKPTSEHTSTPTAPQQQVKRAIDLCCGILGGEWPRQRARKRRATCRGDVHGREAGRSRVLHKVRTHVAIEDDVVAGGRDLRYALERDDREMLPSGSVADAKLNDRTGSTPNERMRLRARRSTWR